MFLTLFSIVASLALADPAGVSTSAQPEDVGVIPPVLVAQATLHYPEAAYAEQLHGTIVLQVHITSEGLVETVRVNSGPEIFYEEAKIAAKRLKFEPALRDGQAIAFDTTVTFHFSPPHLEPKDDDEHPDHSIVVSSDSLHNQTAHVEEVLTEEELDQRRTVDLARTLEGVAGVEFASGSGNTSKPLIRGQTERRLLIVRDGIPHASQKWGIDHAPEIDVFDVGTITIRKGTEAVRYGGDAIGGVILVESPEIADNDGVYRKTIVGASSNGLKAFGMGRVDLRQSDWAGRLQGNWLNSADVQTPDYVLGNTAVNVWNTGGVLTHRRSVHSLTFRGSHHHNSSGVFYGMRSETPSDLEAALNATQPLNAEAWTVGRGKDKPYQKVNHTKASLDWEVDPTWGTLNLQYAYQRNERHEAEPSRIPDAPPQFNFLLHTHSAELFVDHADWMLGTAELDVEWGASAKLQDNLYAGLTLIPNYRQLDLGAFWTQRLIFSQTSISMGVRLDGSHQYAYMTDSDYDAHERRDLLPEECQITDDIARCTTQYSGNAFVLGGVWQAIPEALEFRGDLSTGVRFPNVDERYLLGAAPSFPVFAMGDPNLPKEQVRSGTLTVGYRNELFSTELSGYGNWIDNYIYFAPWTVDGTLQNVTLINGSFPIYRFQSVNALFFGMDGTVAFFEDTPVVTSISGATVRAWNVDTTEHLVGIPPDSIRLQTGWTGERASVQPSVSYVAKQHRVSSELDFADAPEGFVLVNLLASYSHMVSHSEWTWNLSAINLFNQTYRRYTSLLRYYADDPGRDVQISLSTNF